MAPPLVLAIDWSGALAGARRKIWIAEARPRHLGRFARLVRLECGRDREATVAHLVDLARREPRIVVGLDFAFSFPAWFLHEHGLPDAGAAWELAAAEGEGWLRACPPPFWGRPGRPRPERDPARPAFRRTEGERLPVRGIGPKSVFQIGGAGAVGTGSLRGMPELLELRRAGFSIWPFDPPRPPTVIEIYPRWLTGRVRKARRLARALHLAARADAIGPRHAELAASSEDAFDAAVSALRMAEHAGTFERLGPARDATEAAEGRIWFPEEDPALSASPSSARSARGTPPAPPPPRGSRAR